MEGKSPNVYVVFGNETIGDKYPQYLVRERTDGTGDWTCDCLDTNRTGGHYRATCSHITGVLLHIQEHGEWMGPEVDGVHGPKPDAVFMDEMPQIVTPRPARKDSPDIPVFEMTHHPVPPKKKPGVVCIECGEEFDTNSISDFRRVCSECRGKVPEPQPDFPESSSPPLDPEIRGEKSTTTPPVDFPVIEPEQLWELIEQDPDWIPHPGQIKLNSTEPDLPSKFQEFRPSQWMAIREIDAALDAGYKAVFVSAPTGSGKTLLAESIRRLRGIRGIYTCTTKTLQDQILREFEYAKVIKGRANYPTLDNPLVTAADCNKRKATFPACKDCPGWSGGSSWGIVETDMSDPTVGMTNWHCTNCHPWDQCPYEVAKFEAGAARLAVLNTAYFLAETNYVNNSLFRGRGLCLIDEADMLEAELMRFVEVQITARDRKLLGIGLPEKKTVDESWVEWLADEVAPAVKDALADLNLSPDLFGDFDVDEIRKKKKLVQLLRKVKSLLQKEEDPETGEITYTLNDDWVYTGYEKDMDGNYPPDNKVNVTFKPIHVQAFSDGILWSRASQFVLLSATFVSPAMEAEFLGLGEDEWTVVEVPSSFPVLQRPIIPRMVADVTNKNIREATPLLIDEIAQIMDEHPNERILVHSVSYRLTKDLFFELKHKGYGGRLETYFDSRDRESALNRYLDNPRGVLIAPSFDRGVDLPADDCKVIVVAKVPYLSVGDKQVSARLFGTGRAGKIWYAVQAIRSLCQMTGRGMRSADDSCRTYILDRQFSRLYRENRRLFPKWWADAIVWDVNDPKWRGMA
jgi:Rad3-related DNA helicase